MFLLRLHLLWLLAISATATSATSTTSTTTDSSLLRRHLQSEMNGGIPLTLNQPYEHKEELLKDVNQIFTLELQPDDIGHLISCSVMADNGDVDLEVGLDQVPDAYHNACTSISDDSDESCPVLIRPDHQKLVVLVKAQQRTTDFTVLCQHEDVTPLTIGQASAPKKVDDGTYLLFSLPVPTEDDGSLLCTVQGTGGDLGLRASLDSLNLGTETENPTKACFSQNLRSSTNQQGPVVQACNVTATSDDKYLYVYVKAFQSSYDVQVTCTNCEADYYPGTSRIGYADQIRSHDETMRCKGDPGDNGASYTPPSSKSSASEKPKYKSSDDDTSKSFFGGSKFFTCVAFVAAAYGSLYVYRQKKQQQYQHHHILQQHDPYPSQSLGYSNTETELPTFR